MPQKRSLETREKILKAATAAFSRDGFDATGVAEICAAAGVSKGAFYHHFQSKQEVFLKLTEEWLSGLDQQIQRLAASAEDVPQALWQTAKIAPAVFADARGQVPLFLEFWRQANRDPQIWQATVAPYHRYTEYFAGMIRQGIEEGSLREMPPEVGARILVSLAVGLLLQGALDPEGADWGTLVGDGVRLLLEGMGANSKREWRSTLDGE
ncbi:MAG: TetR/AcrR family transcriptional regulator [Anaerolineales bacterium]|jgi:AcrR family transcriptional regulator